jgi:hypothetical protein
LWFPDGPEAWLNTGLHIVFALNKDFLPVVLRLRFQWDSFIMVLMRGRLDKDYTQMQ